MITKVVIPAAGLGTRLYPITRAQPKEMLPLGRKPAIQLVVEECLSAGLTHILIVTGRTKRAIEDHFDNSHTENCSALGPLFPGVGEHFKLFYIRQSPPRGLGDAVLQAEPFVKDEVFAVALGDAVIHSSSSPSLLERMLRLYATHSPSAVVAVRRVPQSRLSSYGVVKPARIPYGTEPFLIDDLVEKPAPEKAPSDYAITARYIFSPEIFLYLHRTPPGADGEIQLTDAIRAMVRVGRQVWAVPLVAGEVRYDVGNFLDYAKAFIDIALADPQVGHALREHLLQMLVDGPAKEALSATSDEETGWL